MNFVVFQDFSKSLQRRLQSSKIASQQHQMPPKCSQKAPKRLPRGTQEPPQTPPGLLLGPFWPPQIAPKISKAQKTLKICKKMLLGRILGSLWQLLGSIWELLASTWTSWTRFGTILKAPGLNLGRQMCPSAVKMRAKQSTETDFAAWCLQHVCCRIPACSLFPAGFLNNVMRKTTHSF